MNFGGKERKYFDIAAARIKDAERRRLAMRAILRFLLE